MAENSKIEWTDATFNPWEGCQKVGPGCDNCYAEARNARFGGGTAPNWGPGAPRRRTSPANWRKPLQWNAEPFAECGACGWRGADPHEGAPGWVECPACGKETLTKARRRVFCASLADVFDNEVPPVWRADLFKLITDTPNLDWLLLTKRIGNVFRMMPFGWQDFGAPANLWLGATVVNQEEADRDIPKLLATPARVRFLSMEPLLGPVDLASPYTLAIFNKAAQEDRLELPAARQDPSTGLYDVAGEDLLPGLHWVIAGGESGPGARPMHPDWARSLRDQCKAAGVPFMFKQWGEWAPFGFDGQEQGPSKVWRSWGGLGWGEYRGGPTNDCVARIGKKAAGRLLDGCTHDEFPEVR